MKFLFTSLEIILEEIDIPISVLISFSFFFFFINEKEKETTVKYCYGYDWCLLLETFISLIKYVHIMHILAIRYARSRINRTYDGVEAETRKSQASFQII